MPPLGVFSITYCAHCQVYHVFFNEFELMSFEDPNDAKDTVLNLVEVCQFSYFEANVAMTEYEIDTRRKQQIYFLLHNPSQEFLQ